jgi:hypothetical protein
VRIRIRRNNKKTLRNETILLCLHFILGWHLVLDVDQATQGDMILPCPPRQPLVQYNLSELYSAPGRQAASMINSTHLRSLESSLSAVATATSLAETDPAMAKPIDGKN